MLAEVGQDRFDARFGDDLAVVLIVEPIDHYAIVAGQITYVLDQPLAEVANGKSVGPEGHEVEQRVELVRPRERVRLLWLAVGRLDLEDQDLVQDVNHAHFSAAARLDLEALGAAQVRDRKHPPQPPRRFLPENRRDLLPYERRRLLADQTLHIVTDLFNGKVARIEGKEDSMRLHAAGGVDRFVLAGGEEVVRDANPSTDRIHNCHP